MIIERKLFGAVSSQGRKPAGVTNVLEMETEIRLDLTGVQRG